jgi:hypothetical protein
MDARSNETAGQFILGIALPPDRFLLHTNDDRFLGNFIIHKYKLNSVVLCEFARESDYSFVLPHPRLHATRLLFKFQI